jgi:glycosyltransferase involved in cell wall biosynthesis
VRVLFDYRPALRRRTGVGSYVHETLAALAAGRPDDESLVAFSASWKDRLATTPVPGVEVVDRAIPVRLLNLLWHRFEWPSVESLAGEGFAVVQSAHPLLVPSHRAAQVVTIYDLDFLDHPERTHKEIRRDYGPLVGTHARRADQVIVISRHTAEAVEHRLGVPASHISVCVPGAPDWPAREAEPVRDGCILFLGSLEPRKNLDVLLDAYTQMVSAAGDVPPLVLAGQIPDSARPLVARTKAAPLAGRVELPGYVDDGGRRELYRRALMFVLPSHTEGFGLPALEAMVSGVPVIAAKRGALVESVGDAGILVDPPEASGFARAMTDLVASPSRRRALGEAGRRHAAAFSWRGTADAMRAAWHLAVEHRARRHD